MKIEIGEKNRVEVYDKRSKDTSREITGKIVKVEGGETLGEKWTEILLDTGYKIIFK